MTPGHAAVALGLTSAVSWGAADFSGGLASRRASVFGVVVVGQGLGALLMIILALASAEPWLLGVSIGWGLAAGVVGGVGIAGLYRALAMDQMGIAAPVTAVLAAGIPAVVGIFIKGFPHPGQLAGFALAICGMWFVSRPAGAVGRPKGFGLALIAGGGLGASLVLISHAGTTGVFWPLAVVKASSFVTILAVALGTDHPWRCVIGSWRLVALSGVLDAGGNALFLAAAQLSRLDVAAVLSSLYPAATVALATLLLRERMTYTQTVGAVAALIAIPLIAS